MIKNNKILIATGGTGGHVFPSCSLADYFIRNNYNVVLTTDVRGLSYIKNRKNLNVIKISSSPIIKKNILKFLLSIIMISFSILRSLFFLLFDRPSIVFGMGGYSSFPVCIAAKILRIKIVIYESNLTIGRANKYLLPFATKIFVAYRDLEGIPVKYDNKIIEIGNIVSEEIINFKVENYKLNELKILVLGGSQGAKVFAEKLPRIFEKLKNSKMPIKVYQQCQNEQKSFLMEFYKKKK